MCIAPATVALPKGIRFAIRTCGQVIDSKALADKACLHL